MSGGRRQRCSNLDELTQSDTTVTVLGTSHSRHISPSTPLQLSLGVKYGHVLATKEQ